MSTSNEHAIEKTRIFPYIAWSLTLGFVLFVYTLVMELQAEVDSLQTAIEARQYEPVPRTPSPTTTTPSSDT